MPPNELLKIPARLLLPPGLRRWLKAKLLGEPYTPGIGAVRFGDLRRVTPICRDFGGARGQAVDRVYVEDFLDRKPRGHPRQQPASATAPTPGASAAIASLIPMSSTPWPAIRKPPSSAICRAARMCPLANMTA
jgi:hypothetical protein